MQFKIVLLTCTDDKSMSSTMRHHFDFSDNEDTCKVYVVFLDKLMSCINLYRARREGLGGTSTTIMSYGT